MLFKKTCKFCGQVFYTKRYPSQFCSQSCYFKQKRADANKKRLEVIDQYDSSLGNPISLKRYFLFFLKTYFPFLIPGWDLFIRFVALNTNYNFMDYDTMDWEELFFKHTNHYMDPNSDYGFEWLFGKYDHKDIIINFLNAFFDSLSPSEHRLYKRTVVDFKFLSIDNDCQAHPLDSTEVELICQCTDGQEILFGLHKHKPEDMIRRLTSYGSIPDEIFEDTSMSSYPSIRASLAILNFNHFLNESPLHKFEVSEYFDISRDCDSSERYVIELPKVRDELSVDSPLFDKWLYLIKKMTMMRGIPEFLNEEIFERVLDVMDCDNLHPYKLREYIHCLTLERNVLEFLANYHDPEREQEGFL